MTGSVARVVEVLLLAERQIRLLDRVRPLELAKETERLVSAWNGGGEPFADLRYASRPDLTKLRRGLALLVEHSADFGDEGPWLGARAQELGLEAEMAEVVGTPALGAVAAKRFRLPSEQWAGGVQSLVVDWQSAEQPAPATCSYRTDDTSEPNSLYSVLRARLDDLKLNVSLRIEPDLSSVAATGDGSVRILSGARLSLVQSKRITEHELVAHLIPRQNARNATGALKCGCACASADEEGRALVIEERSSLMDVERKRELAFRHGAGVWSRQGADFVQVVRELRQRGAAMRSALVIALRCFRGSTAGATGQGGSAGQGGLGRELIYLPAYLRLKAAFEGAPQLEQWLVRGRASLDYARYRAGSSSSTQTGT